MRFYDTAQKQYVDWQPPKTVRIYVCGITPYDSAHLGHIFTFMTYDILQRRLEDMGREVVMVRNVTDVDEPIYRKARELGINYQDLAVQETALFKDVLSRLNFRSPFNEPLASEYIDKMATSVDKLLRSGAAYRLDEDIYFDIAQDPLFGSFSPFDDKLRLGLLKSRGGDPGRPGKRQSMDFLLWRGVADASDPAAWDTPLGRGRPGWHIECSVMSSELLGVPFDLHGGGSDLIFPHHECEIAQTRALTSGEAAGLSRYWLHVAPILYGGEKMSKSLGNLVFAKDLLEQYEPAVIRLALMHYHYQIGGEWIPKYLEASRELLERVRAASWEMSETSIQSFGAEVRAAIDDDLDTHRIVHALEDIASGQISNQINLINPDSVSADGFRDIMGMLGLA